MVPSMFGDMFGAVGNLGGGLVLMNKIQDKEDEDDEMSVESHFTTMGDGETDWLFSPNKIRNFVKLGVKLHKIQIEEEQK